jgi:microcystin-dependent protein
MGFKPFQTGDGLSSDVASFLLFMPRSDWFKQSVIGALSEMAYSFNWFENGDQTTKVAAETAAQMINELIVMDFNPIPVGKIDGFGGGSAPDGWLLCDGSSYLETDYPELFSVIGTVWGGGSGSFNVPDLIGRVMIGAGDVYDVADNGGETEHTLIESELAAHNHVASGTAATDIGHTHVESTAVPAVSVLGAGVPFPYALPGVGATGIGFANITMTDPLISLTGGDNPHNNMQPFAVVNLIIFAGR